MGMVSVAEAARLLGVGVPRIHQRIRDGSLPAQRLGSQWVIDELALLHLRERSAPGRPWSARSAWAVIALIEGDDEALAQLAGVERSRARDRLRELLQSVRRPPRSEEAVRQVAAELRLRFRNRAEMLARRAVPADLDDVRDDARWQASVRAEDSGIGSHDVVGYLRPQDVADVQRMHLLVPAASDGDANVHVYVLPPDQAAYPDSRLRLAADLADRRGPREEARAVELLIELASEQERVAR